jgi:hypothetical protein
MTPPPAAPNPMSTMLAGLSQAELIMLAGGAAIVVLDILLWFVSGYSFSVIILAGAALAVVLILLRSKLTSGLATNYTALLLVIAIVVAFMGARNLILDVLNLGRGSGLGTSAMYLLGMLVVAGGSAAIAFGGWQLWRRGR